MRGELGLAIALGSLTIAWLLSRAIARTEFPFDTYGDVPELPDEARVNHVHHSSQINSEG